MQHYDVAKKSGNATLCRREGDAYPTAMHAISGIGSNLEITIVAAVYGYVHGGTATVTSKSGVHHLNDSGCFVVGRGSLIEVTSKDTTVVLFFRYGYNPLEMFSAREAVGRLSYIDGCSDTVLIPPPRAGDACLNHLHFPVGILQTQHIHPTIRLGLVVSGHGRAYCDDPNNTWEIGLYPGVAFMLTPQERHSFRTDLDSDTMDIIAFHPDSNTGPTDDNHPMINRTYIKHGGGK